MNSKPGKPVNKTKMIVVSKHFENKLLKSLNPLYKKHVQSLQ